MQVVSELGVGLDEPFDYPRPRNPRAAGGQRYQLRNRPPVHCDPQTLPRLDPPQDLCRLVS